MEPKKKKREHGSTILFPACLGMGVGLGALIRNIGVGLAIGAGIGTILSLLVEKFLSLRAHD